LTDLRLVLETLKTRQIERTKRLETHSKSTEAFGGSWTPTSEKVETSLETSSTEASGTVSSLTGLSQTLTDTKQASDGYDRAVDRTVTAEDALAAGLSRERWVWAGWGAAAGAGLVVAAWLLEGGVARR